MGLDVRKPDFAACEQQKHRPACASAQSGLCLCCSLSVKYCYQTYSMQKFNILTNLCSYMFTWWFERNLEARFTRITFQINISADILLFFMCVYMSLPYAASTLGHVSRSYDSINQDQTAQTYLSGTLCFMLECHNIITKSMHRQHIILKSKEPFQRISFHTKLYAIPYSGHGFI